VRKRSNLLIRTQCCEKKSSGNAPTRFRQIHGRDRADRIDSGRETPEFARNAPARRLLTMA